MRTRIALLATVALTGGLTATARADAKAEAVALFEQGIADMQAGKTEQACRELAASLRKYEDSGTKGALAECYTQLGRVASSWRLWKELSDTAPTEDLRADAANNAQALTARLPRFKLVVTAPLAPGLAVTVNDSPADPQLSVELPIDPGPITVNVTAPKHEPWSSTFTAFEGKLTEITVPRLTPSPEPVTPPQPVAPAPGTGPVDTAAYEQQAGTRHRRRVLGATLGITGVVGLGAGTVLGLSAISSWRKAKDACMDMLDPCRGDLAAATDYTDDARLAARLSTGFLVLGGVALVTGAVFWLTAPELGTRTARITPIVTTDLVGLSFSGSLR